MRKGNKDKEGIQKKVDSDIWVAVLLLSHMRVLIVLKGDDDTQSHGVSANTNPTLHKTVPHKPLLQAG